MRTKLTMIEWLVVTGILAIMMLIATPITINIINGIKLSTEKNTINGYGKAIENAVAEYAVENPNDVQITMQDIESYISYSRSQVDCEFKHLTKNKDIYLSGCSIKGKKTKYSYGKAPVTIGDTINYDAEVDGYEGSWKVIGKENGQILIVSDIIGTLTLSGSEGYNNGIKHLNEFCQQYGNGNGATEVRSINVSDINTITGYKPEEHLNNTYYQFPGDTLGNYNNEVSYTNINGKMIYTSTNGTIGAISTNTFNKLDGTALKEGQSVTITNDYYEYNLNSNHLSINADSIEDKLIVGEELFSKDILYYWLADQSELGLSKSLSYGIRTVSFEHKSIDSTALFESSAGDLTFTYGVRAVVYLDQNISLVKDQNNIWQIY